MGKARQLYVVRHGYDVCTCPQTGPLRLENATRLSEESECAIEGLGFRTQGLVGVSLQVSRHHLRSGVSVDTKAQSILFLNTEAFEA